MERQAARERQQVEQGAALPGLYPPNSDNKARFEQARARRAEANGERKDPSK